MQIYIGAPEDIISGYEPSSHRHTTSTQLVHGGRDWSCYDNL